MRTLPENYKLCRLKQIPWLIPISQILVNTDDTQHGAGVVLVTTDLGRLYHVNHHQLNMCSKLGSRQKLSSVPHLMIYSEVVG